LRRPDLADFAFAGLVIVISVAPLLSVTGWQGYGPGGEYSCICGKYYIRFADPAYGGDKPHVFVQYQGFQVDALEFSDIDSKVNGANLYSGYSVQRSLTNRGLLLDYSSASINFTKMVSESNGTVYVSYSFGRDVSAQLTFWRWYFTTVGPFSLPVTRTLGSSHDINFSFFGQGAVFNATLVADPAPTVTSISGVQGAGLNKVTMDFNASSISLALRLSAVRSFAGAGVVEVGSSLDAFPVMGVVFGVAYLEARRRLGTRRSPG